MYKFRVIVTASIFSFIVQSVVSFPYEIFSPSPYSSFPRLNSKVISIQPVDSQAIRRSSHKPPPINPDAETIFHPMHADKFRLDQIMERSSSGGVYYNKPKSHKKKNKFNPLNFDAYLVKPMNFSYKKVFATLKPETEKLMKLMNKTTVLDDEDEKKSKPRSGKGRSSKKRSKGSKKSHGIQDILDIDDHYERDIHTSSPIISSNYDNYNQLNQSSSLPIGMAFFEANNQKNLRTQPTYSPLPISYAFKRSMDTSSQSPVTPKEATSRVFHLNSMEPSAMHSMQNDIKVHSAYTSFTSDDGKNEDDYVPEENRQSVMFEIMPEMYKFTLEDAIRDTRGGIGGSGGDRSFLGPVTEAPPEIPDYPNGLHSKVVEEYVNPYSYQIHEEAQPTADYPMNQEQDEFNEADEILNRAPTRLYEPRRSLSSRGRLRYHDYEQRYNNPVAAASRVVQREYRINSPKPTTITSDVAITEDNPSSDIITKSPRNFQFMNWDPVQLKTHTMKMEKKNITKYTTKPNEKIKNDIKLSKRKGRRNNLEVTDSYSRQRTQGASDSRRNENQEERTVNQNANNDEMTDHHNDEFVASSDQVQRAGTRPSEVNYFQYVNVLAKDIFTAGVGKGNENHYIEQHERANGSMYQRRVKWNDKRGGFGEHFYDLNHH